MFERTLCRYLPSGTSSSPENGQVSDFLAAIKLCFLSLALVLWSSTFAVGEELRFSHQLSLHPISPLQSLITLVSAEEGKFKSVRALMVLDGELLAVPMFPESDGKSYRGTFPRPRESLSYRFQVSNDMGGARMSRPFEITPDCIRGQFQPLQSQDPDIRRALGAQQQRQRLLSARDMLRKFMERIGDVH